MAVTVATVSACRRYTHLIPGNHQRFVNLIGKPAPDAAKAPVKRKRAA